MARTKASVGAKLMSGKSSKVKSAAPAPSSSSSGSRKSSHSKSKEGAGNSYCPRETPDWQKQITSFFVGSGPSNASNDGNSSDEDAVITSKRKKTRVITSDNESDCEENVTTLNDTTLNNSTVSDCELSPPSPDDTCHKIGEYFNAANKEANSEYKGKGKGKGKKSSDMSKENIEPENNTSGDKGNKRSLNSSVEPLGDNQPMKKVKIST